MARESLAGDSRFIGSFVQVKASGLFSFRARLEIGGNADSRNSGRIAEPPAAWIRIERQGNTFVNMTSTDGESWAVLDQRDLVGWPDTLHVGIAATGKDIWEMETFSFAGLQAGVAYLELSPLASFQRGDTNSDGALDVSDALCVLRSIFLAECPMGCVAAANANGDDDVDMTDAVYLLVHLFAGGAAPAAPFPDCGPGLLPADEELGCIAPPEGCRQ